VNALQYHSLGCGSGECSRYNDGVDLELKVKLKLKLDPLLDSRRGSHNLGGAILPPTVVGAVQSSHVTCREHDEVKRVIGK
jgi:hypothetical protein